jgi:hypothetical protein
MNVFGSFFSKRECCSFLKKRTKKLSSIVAPSPARLPCGLGGAAGMNTKQGHD